MNRIAGQLAKILNLGLSNKSIHKVQSAAASTINLDAYYPLQAPRFGDLAEGNMNIARQEFELYLSQIDERIEKLKSFCESNHVRFGKSDEALTSMCQFVFDEMYPSEDDQDAIAGIWIEYVLDVAAHLGQIIIEKCPDVEWCLFDYHPDDHPDYLEIGLRNKVDQQLYFALFNVIIGGTLQEFRNNEVDPEMRAEFFSGIVNNWSQKLSKNKSSAELIS